jgi:hypothetical protein
LSTFGPISSANANTFFAPLNNSYKRLIIYRVDYMSSVPPVCRDVGQGVTQSLMLVQVTIHHHPKRMMAFDGYFVPYRPMPFLCSFRSGMSIDLSNDPKRKRLTVL